MTATRIVVALIVLALAGIGQVRDLSTDHTGSVLYFAANMTAGSVADFRTSRIFRWEPGQGIKVFVEDAFSFGDASRRTAGFHGVDSPSVSADGTRVAFMQHSGCGGVGCVRPQQGPARYGIAVVTDPSGKSPLFHVWGWEGARLERIFREPGYAKVEISANGRYVICRNGPNGGFGGVRDTTLPTRDFGGSFGIVFPYSTAGTRQMLSNEGLAVWGSEGKLSESREAGLFPPITEIAGAVPVMNATGTIVVYETLAADGASRQLLALDRVTGRQWFLWADPDIENPGVLPHDPFIRDFFFDPYPEFPDSMFGASIDASGRLVAVRAREAPGQARRWLVIVPLDATAPKWLFDAGEEILELTLSGNGRWVFMATASGKLLRIDVESGGILELLGTTPWIKKIVGASSLGARNRILGGGFASRPTLAESTEGVPELGGLRVEYNGQVMPLLEVAPAEIVFRIPQDFDRRDHGYAVRVKGPSESGYLPTLVSRSGDLAFGVVDGVAVEPPGAIGEDGQRLHPGRPAQPGEVISIFSTGWRSVAANITCSMTVAFGPGSIEELRFPTVSHGLVPDKPGLFELRLLTPEAVAWTLGRSGFLHCSGGEPREGFAPLAIPLHK